MSLPWRTRRMRARASRPERSPIWPWCSRPGARGGTNERPLEIRDEILYGFDPDGQPHEVARRRKRRVCGGSVRHLRRQLDQALDPAERLRELEELRPCDEANRLLLRLGEERDHPAE